MLKKISLEAIPSEGIVHSMRLSEGTCIELKARIEGKVIYALPCLLTNLFGDKK